MLVSCYNYVTYSIKYIENHSQDQGFVFRPNGLRLVKSAAVYLHNGEYLFNAFLAAGSQSLQMSIVQIEEDYNI